VDGRRQDYQRRDGRDHRFDVTGHIAAYNAQWKRAAEGLRALLEPEDVWEEPEHLPTANEIHCVGRQDVEGVYPGTKCL
jgi:hypothetical protein